MSDSPKIIINDDYLDLREKTIKEQYNQKQNYLSLKNEGLKQDRELLLRNLANYLPCTNHKSQQKKKKTVYHDPRFRKLINSTDTNTCLNSHSELLLSPAKITVHPICPSAPQILRRGPLRKAKEEPDKNLQTLRHMKINDLESNNGDKVQHTNTEEERAVDEHYLRNTRETNNTRDPRLLRKYSVLKLPWKRTWTLPVIVRKSEACLDPKEENVTFDRKTYKYDDGTEVDSIITHKHAKISTSRNPHSKTMLLLFFVGSLCGLLMVSFIIWVMFVTETLQKGLLQSIMTFVKKMGRILTVPSHEVFQVPPEETNWIWSYWLDP